MPLIRKPTETTAAAGASDIRSSSADARWAAAREIVGSEGVSVLSEALAIETEPRVREAILTSLARIGTPAAAQAVATLIASDDASLRTAALDALRAMPDAVGGLAALLADHDPDVRLLACEIFRQIPGAEASRMLAELLDREVEVNVCAAALDVLAEVGGDEALPALGRCEARFAEQPFLVFAARVAADRIGAKPARPLG